MKPQGHRMIWLLIKWRIAARRDSVRRCQPSTAKMCRRWGNTAVDRHSMQHAACEDGCGLPGHNHFFFVDSCSRLQYWLPPVHIFPGLLPPAHACQITGCRCDSCYARSAVLVPTVDKPPPFLRDSCQSAPGGRSAAKSLDICDNG